MTKNRLSDLNDHLFAQIERLSDESLTPEQVEKEAKRGTAIVGAADMIIRNAMLQVRAAEVAAEFGGNPEPYLTKFGGITEGQLIEARKQ
jgi:hypothetical protein